MATKPYDCTILKRFVDELDKVATPYDCTVELDWAGDDVTIYLNDNGAASTGVLSIIGEIDGKNLAKLVIDGEINIVSTGRAVFALLYLG